MPYKSLKLNLKPVCVFFKSKMKSPLILKKVWPGFTQILHLFYRVYPCQ